MYMNYIVGTRLITMFAAISLIIPHLQPMGEGGGGGNSIKGLKLIHQLNTMDYQPFQDVSSRES